MQHLFSPPCTWLTLCCTAALTSSSLHSLPSCLLFYRQPRVKKPWRAGADDITAIGPANIVFGAVEAFGREVRERCLLHWERTKTEVFTWAGVLPAECKCLLLQIPIGTCRGRELSHKVLCTEKVICINFEDLISLIQGGFFKLALARFF